MTDEAAEQLCQTYVGCVEELIISKSSMKQLMEYLVISDYNVLGLTIGRA